MNLSPEIMKMIEERLRTGRYDSRETVIAAALLSLEQQEVLGDFDTGELDELLADGERSITEEGTLDGEEAFLMRRKRRKDKR